MIMGSGTCDESNDDCQSDEPLTLVLLVGIVSGHSLAYAVFLAVPVAADVQHDIPGLTEYISSFGSVAVFIMILLIVLTNMTGLPSVQFVTVNGILFGLVPGILISWAGQVIGNVLAFVIMRYVFRHKLRP